MRQGRQRVFTPGGNLLRVAKQTVAKTVRRFGYELQRIKDAPAPQPDFWVWLRQSQQIRTVIDIGANVGEFAAFLFRYFQPNALYAFEPLPSCQSALQARAAVSPNFQVFPLALSDHAGRECFYENSYPPSSSLLRIGDISRQEFPQTSGESPCVVQVALLDSVLRAADLEKNIFIKIDVQGVEDRVIRGGRNVFAAASCVLIEMSFASMYDGQPLFEEVHVLLADLGLRFAGMKNQIAARSGQPLFAHCLYVRAEPQQ
jgi:FkbM family methyltransferase